MVIMSPIDYLVEGLVGFSGFTGERVQQDGRQVMTGSGFVSDEEQPVGVLYNGFTWIRIQEESPRASCEKGGIHGGLQYNEKR